MMTITDDIRAKSWGTKSDALKFFRRNDTTPAELADAGWIIEPSNDKRYRLLSISPDNSIAPAKIEAKSPTLKRSTPKTPSIADVDAKILAERSAKLTADTQATTAAAPPIEIAAPVTPAAVEIVTTLPAAINPHRLEVVASNTLSGDWSFDATRMWAYSIAKKLRSDVNVRNVETGEIAFVATYRKPRLERAARAPGEKSPRLNGAFDKMIALLQREEGASADEMKTTLGWKSAPGQSYLEIVTKRKKLTLRVEKGERRRDTRYFIEATPAV